MSGGRNDWIRDGRDGASNDKGILEGKAEVRPAENQIVEQYASNIYISGGNFNGAQALVKVDGGILLEDPDDHASESSGAQIADENFRQKATGAIALAISKQIDGVHLGIVAIDGLADWAPGDEAEDARLIFRNMKEVLPCFD
jgi:hypothetical protein